MDSIEEMAAKLDADRREAAEMMTFGQRAIAGVAWFDVMTAAMRAGIRLQYPDATEDSVETILLERLRAARKHEAVA